jgi:hypothetical protein
MRWWTVDSAAQDRISIWTQDLWPQSTHVLWHMSYHCRLRMIIAWYLCKEEISGTNRDTHLPFSLPRREEETNCVNGIWRKVKSPGKQQHYPWNHYSFSGWEVAKISVHLVFPSTPGNNPFRAELKHINWATLFCQPVTSQRYSWVLNSAVTNYFF